MYLIAAELMVDEATDEAATVATGNAVLAGIAAADALCGYASGERYRGPDHRAAADYLERVTGDESLGLTLRELVDLKDAGHYGVGNVSRTNATTSRRQDDVNCANSGGVRGPVSRRRRSKDGVTG